MDTQDHEARIVELETRIAFQDQTLLALNDTVARLSRQLDEFGRRLDAALGDLDRVRTMLFADPGEEPPPPHY